MYLHVNDRPNYTKKVMALKMLVWTGLGCQGLDSKHRTQDVTNTVYYSTKTTQAAAVHRPSWGDADWSKLN